MSVLEKFLDYVKFDTKSDETSTTIPSTPGQKVLGAHLVEVMKDIGIADARMDEFGYVYGSIPGNVKKAKTVGFVAHMDTASEISGKDVKPRVIDCYDGEDIVLNEDKGIVTKVAAFPNLKNYVGKKLVVTDGTTLLGGDDKAGIAIILQAAEEIITQNLPHGDVKICFTPDEEIGRGPDKFDVPGFAADFAYTIDGGTLGGIDYENFNGASALVEFTGRSVHPGGAKNKMISAMKVAIEFASMMDPFEVPEHTAGYEGFNHLVHMEGDIEHAKLAYIIRDHDRNLLNKKKADFERIADYLNAKYEIKPVKLTIKDAYSNMREKIYPDNMFIVDLAKDAMRANNVEPVVTPIRGGTDGATLSFMGLPCPNLCTGGENAHGPHEYVCVDSMETIVKIVETIIDKCK
ncbi:MAG: peptidase T [Clostridia bacterium]|nr:peptidase T [Clostridia bacterium]